MTWHRIDENTYIDDTLVTCAEYQLFIDEMREQGKYYQPDHWTSYQFPEGQAREPILGVRHSDTIAFCKWLTTKEGSGVWNYRLQTNEEKPKDITSALGKTVLGYWVYGASQFVWIGSTPKDARCLDFTNASDLPGVRNINFIGIKADPGDANDVQRAIDIARIRTENRIPDIVRNLTHAVARVCSHPLDLDHIIDSTINLFDLVERRTRNPIDNNARDLLHILHRFQKRDLTPMSPEDDYYDGLYFNPDYGDLNDVLNFTIRFTYHAAFKFILDQLFDLYIDVRTLQERIAGRSPAFEGIRLVKERIR